MNRYPAGSDVTVTLPCLGSDGAAVVATGCIAELFDEREDAVSAISATLSADGKSASFAIPGAANALLSAVNASAPWEAPITGLRTLVATFSTAGGLITAQLDYALFQGSAQLIVLKNSFQTYAQAKLTADGMVDLPGFSAAADAARLPALMEAYRRLTRFGYFVRWPANPDAQNLLTGWDARLGQIDSLFWLVMSLDQWTSYYPQDFRDALCRAQVAEADTILAGVDPATDKRNLGITLEKVGESTVQFKQGSKPLDLGIAKRTLDLVKSYISLRTTTTRL